jgi:hypothetical protein
MTEREMIFYLAERAGIVFRLTSTDVTVEKLQRFLELVEGHRTRGWRIKEPKARKVTDVSRGAREVPIDYDGMATFKKEWEWKEMDTVDYRIPDIRVSNAVDKKTRGFLWFWLRPEGGIHKPGLNLTLPGNGFVLTLYTQRSKYRFRFRWGIKPNFLWSKENEQTDYR